MKKLSLLLTVTVLTTVATYAATPDTKVGEKTAPAVPSMAPASLKIYYVDPYKIIPNLKQWEDERVKIQKELEMRTNQIEELKVAYTKKANELQSMSKSTAVRDQAKEAAAEELSHLERSIQIKQQSFQEFAERTSQEAQMSIFREIESAAKEYAQQQNADFVFAGNALYVNPKYEISDFIAEKMNAKYLAQKRAPAQSSKDQTSAPK